MSGKRINDSWKFGFIFLQKYRSKEVHEGDQLGDQFDLGGHFGNIISNSKYSG